MDRLVPLEAQGQQETQDLLETLGQKAHLDHPAILVQLDRRGQLVLLDPTETQALKETQAQKDLQEALALQVHQGQKTAW